MANTTGTAVPADFAGSEGEGVRRRDFINIAAVSAAGVGGLATLVPLVSQMWPSADVLAESSTDVDLSAIQPGQAIKAVFRKQPLFIRNLTPAEIAAAGVGRVEKLGLDTYAEPARFFSFRRATHLGEPNYGRQFSLIGLPFA